jgi:class 3 adenylate cyclase
VLPDLALKIGLNAGEPISEDEDLFGAVVQVAARACDAAAPDQILVTLSCGPWPWARACVAEAGERDFKGVAEPVPLWSVLPG